MRALTRSVLAVLVLAAGALAGAVAGDRGREQLQGADAFLRRYAELLTAVQSNAPLPVTAAELIYSSLDGMLEMLDPHTNFLRPELFAQMRERQQGSFHGIGVIISVRGGKVTVITPVEGTPAARLGLRAGDIIETVDGTATEGMDLDEVAKRLRGPEGTSVTIAVSRPGLAAPLEITLQRARVPSDSIRYTFMVDATTGYIRISDFIRTTGDEFRRALVQLQRQGASRLVLDLRDNPGGIVDSAVEVAGMLLQPGQQVFSTRGRTADSFQNYRAPAGDTRFSGPVVVLINRGSASAAEIVAGAIQDHDRGVIIGENTFGKGVVQTVFPVRNAGLALTTAKYYTPSGRCIQREYDSFFDYVRPTNGGPAGNAEVEAPAADTFFTDAGRRVFGGGGVTPDREVSQQHLSERLARLVGNSAFFHFAVETLAGVEDKQGAARRFVVSPEVLAAFRDRVLAGGWLVAEDIDAALADERDRRDIEVGLVSEVLNVGVSLAEGYRAAITGDDQIQAALQAFEQARELHARATSARRGPH